MAGRKCTAAEVERRILITMRFLREGLKAEEILKITTESENTEKRKEQEKKGYIWNIKIDMVRNYISKATERFKKVSRVDEAYQRGLIIERLEHIYKKSIQLKNYKTALTAIKQLTDFFGFNVLKIKEESSLSSEIFKEIKDKGGLSALFGENKKDEL